MCAAVAVGVGAGELTVGVGLGVGVGAAETVVGVIDAVVEIEDSGAGLLTPAAGVSDGSAVGAADAGTLTGALEHPANRATPTMPATTWYFKIRIIPIFTNRLARQVLHVRTDGPSHDWSKKRGRRR
jgi:hypothetical protein